jgi:hypothetical protein
MHTPSQHVDGFHEHSLEEEITKLRASPDCSVTNSRGDCFTAINMVKFCTCSCAYALDA